MARRTGKPRPLTDEERHAGVVRLLVEAWILRARRLGRLPQDQTQEPLLGNGSPLAAGSSEDGPGHLDAPKGVATADGVGAPKGGARATA